MRRAWAALGLALAACERPEAEAPPAAVSGVAPAAPGALGARRASGSLSAGSVPPEDEGEEPLAVPEEGGTSL